MRASLDRTLLKPGQPARIRPPRRRVLEDSRDRIAELLGAALTDRVIFTSGGTESNNLAIRGYSSSELGRFCRHRRSTLAIISAIEHPSISTLADQLSQTGYDSRPSRRRAPTASFASTNFRAMLQTTRASSPRCSPTTKLASSSQSPNFAAICNEQSVPLHTDASQAAGKLPLNFHDLGAATMTIAAHKFGGPLGIGALLVRGDVELAPQLFGGFQQAGIRPGTESVALAVGLRTALELWHSRRQEFHAQLQQLRDRFENLLRTAAFKSCKMEFIGVVAERLPNTSNVAFVGLDRQQLFLALDQAGVACSTGSACASGSSEPSPTTSPWAVIRP